MTIMPSNTRKELLHEAAILPEKFVPELLSYARFLQIQAMSDEEIDARFDATIEAARAIARQEGITDEDIAAEIEAYRAGR